MIESKRDGEDLSNIFRENTGDVRTKASVEQMFRLVERGFDSLRQIGGDQTNVELKGPQIGETIKKVRGEAFGRLERPLVILSSDGQIFDALIDLEQQSS